MPAAARRVLLLEALHENPEHHAGAEYYPYLLDMFQRLGWTCRWWCVSAPWRKMRQGEIYCLRLAEAERGWLKRKAAAFAPDFVALHDRPSPELAADIRAAAPAARLVFTSEKVGYYATVAQAAALFKAPPDCLGAKNSKRFLVQAAEPRFARRFRDAREAERFAGSIRLATPSTCCYGRPARDNRFYKGLDSEAVRSFRGCTFCYVPVLAAGWPTKSIPMAELCGQALAQIEAHQKAAPKTPRFTYLLGQSPLGDRFEALGQALLRRRLKPSTFITMLRPDALLAKRRVLEGVLRGLRAAGHQLRLVSIGADNLSDVENERFNKGVTARQLLACHALLRLWARRYPETFFPEPGFSGILFTPWTRPEDLLANIAAARAIGEQWLVKMVGTLLQLWPGTAITELARHDGLLARRFGSAADISISCVPGTPRRELPWRFADPRVETIHRYAIRLDPRPRSALLGEKDELVQALRRRRAALDPKLGQDYIGLLRLLVLAVAELGAQAGVEQVFDFIAAGRGK